MARYALIDDYLDAMRDGLNWRRDLDDLVSEMEDHLYSTVEHMCSAGQEPAVAERTALTRFGDPKTLAVVYASTTNGGLAMPTNFTRTAGLMAMTAAAFLTLIAVAGATSFAANISMTTGSSEGSNNWMLFYTLGTFALLAAAVMMVVLVMGLRQRTGISGIVPMAALALTALGAVATLIAWFIPGWTILLGAGALLMAWATLRTGIPPTVPTVLYGTGFLFGAATFLILRGLEIGTLDEWGDYPAAWDAGLAVACAITAIGLFGLGRWLRSEEPAEIDSTPIAA